MPRARRLPPNPSLTETVYHRLRADILSCALPPGQEVYEGVLAERYGMSKTPVREALNTLRQEGLVHVLPRRGYQIAPITLKDLAELFELRALVEGGAAAMAANRINDRDLEELERLAGVVYDRAERPSLRLFIQANRDFHSLVAAAAGNARVHEIVDRCLDELERVFYLGADVRDITAEVRHDHHAVVDALRRRDALTARAVMVEQIEHTRQHIITTLLSSVSPSADAHVLLQPRSRPGRPGSVG